MTVTCADCGKIREEHDTTTQVTACPKHGIMARLKARAAAKEEPLDSDFNDELYSIDCPSCLEYKTTLARIGCRYFRPSGITYPIKALVRHVSMQQCGHFMMGRARVHGETLILSGSYGSDGLPDTVSDTVYDLAVPLPDELYQAWKNGGGWNSAGSEAPAMREWALAHLKELRA